MSMLEGVIDRIEEEKVVIHLQDGQELIVPIAKLPNGAGEGDVVYFSILKDAEATEERRETAKQMLNEILKNE